MANEPDNFADKVINSLKKSAKAVDLNDEVVAQSTDPVVLGDIVAFGAPTGGGQGPGVGGNKDIVIIPGYGGAAATSVSQINFYWNAPGTPDATGVDTNIRATIYNFATNPGSGVTRSVFAFGGYDGTNQYKPHPLYGGGTGITSKIFIDPFLGKIDTDFLGLNYSGVAATTDIGAISYDAIQNRIRVGTGGGTAKTLAFTDDVSTTASIATTSQSVNIVTTNTGTFYPLFTSSSTTASGAAVSIDGTDISYNAATNVLTAGQFSGLHTGTAITATTSFYGPLAGTATTAQNVYVTNQTTGTFYPALSVSSATANGIALGVDANLSFDASTNVLTAGQFSGLHTGTAATFTNIYGTLTGTATTAGLATTAQNVNISATTTGTLYPLFTSVSTSASGVAVSVDGTDISYDAATNTLTAGKFSGLAAGTAATFTNFYGTLTGNVSGTSTTSQNLNIVTTNTGTFYPLFTSASTTASGVAVSIDGTDISYDAATNTLTAGKFSGLASGSAATFTNFYGTLTGNVTGTATTSQNVYVTNQTTGTFYPTLSVSSATANGVALGVDANLSFDAATNVLTAGQFSGLHTGAAFTATTAFYGSLVGSATTSQNSNVVAAGSTVTPHYFMIANGASGSGLALSSGTGLTYNLATNTLYATNIVGTVQGTISGIASTASNVQAANAGSNATHYLMFATPATATNQAGLALSSNTSITYNPSTGVFSLGSGSATINGLTLGATSNTITTSSGNLTLNASGGTVVIGGNLNVQGTATYIDSTVQTITDPVIVVGSGAGGTHTNVTDTQDRGIEYRRFSGSAITGFFGLSNTSNRFTFIPNANLSAANTYTGSVGVIEANLTGTAITATNFYGPLTGNAASATTAGLATTSQNVNIVTANTGTFYPLFTSLSSSASGAAVSIDGSDISYNFATNTLTAGQFSGLHTGTAFTATTAFYGSLVGTATTSQNLSISATTTGTLYPLFTSVSTSASGVAVSVDGTDISYDAATNTLTAGKFSGLAAGTAATFTNFYGTLVGSLTGSATTSQSVNIVTTNTGTFYPLFTSSSTTASGAAVSIDGTDISYNAATNVLTAGQFSGLVTGAAITATTSFYGPLSGTATTSQNAYVTQQTTGTFYPTLSVSSTTANGIALGVDPNLSFDAATNVLTAGQFSGLATGTAATFTNIYGTLTGTATTAGLATTAQNVNISATTTGTLYPLFTSVSTSASGVAVSVDGTDISYNAATNVLTAGQFSGLHTGTAITATTSFYGPLAGTATTAQNVYVTNQTTGTFYPTFSVSSATANGIALGVDSGLAWDAATDTLTSGKFSGLASGTAATFTNFYGTFVGSATTATNLNVVAAASAGAHYLLMSPTASGSGIAVSTDAQLSYVPSTDTLTVSNIFGNSATGVTISNSSALSAQSYLTIQTVSGDDNSSTDFFIRGMTSTAVSKFSVDAAGNLRATTKSFDIEHPTKPGKRLVYGVLEGPEHGVYHRGTVEGKGELKVILPEYWSKLVCPDYSIQLTPWGNYNIHIVEKSTESFTISINGNAITRAIKNIKVDYIIHGSRLDAPLETEQ